MTRLRLHSIAARSTLAVAFAVGLAMSSVPGNVTGAEPRDQGKAVRPIRALYVTGGGFHDFVTQEKIVPPAIAKHVNIDWTIDHTAGKSTEVLIERHKNTEWTKAFDVVLYN